MHVNGYRQDVNELLARMEAVRGRLDEDAQAAKQTVHDLTDWRQVVRKHPLLAVGLAGVAGFLLVPKKQSKHIVSKADLEQLARDNKIVISSESAASPNIVSTVAAIAGAALTRAASNFVAAKLSELNFLGDHEVNQA
jgi:ElaB/YqjD/DUF883 family membrane-anchored ribosome-binding protein